jgi:hypothetical protein
MARPYLAGGDLGLLSVEGAGLDSPVDGFASGAGLSVEDFSVSPLLAGLGSDVVVDDELLRESVL